MTAACASDDSSSVYAFPAGSGARWPMVAVLGFATLSAARFANHALFFASQAGVHFIGQVTHDV